MKLMWGNKLRELTVDRVNLPHGVVVVTRKLRQLTNISVDTAYGLKIFNILFLV